MNETHQKQVSKLLSLVLRHQPETIGIALDAGGWVAVEALLPQLAAHGHPVTREQLEQLVAANNKQRFALSADGLRIRASQGHSLPVDLELQQATPPGVLYHGTVAPALEAIRREGLRPMSRQHVHLSADVATALAVGQRRGKPVLLAVASEAMHHDGRAFYQSQNGVWLAEAVPPEYLRFPENIPGA